MLIFNKIYSYINNLKKHGFTLAEALIITIMTGYCLLPILGTMQNAQKKAEAFDHRSKMQIYARSRMTNEIANTSFEQKTINSNDEYNYIVYLDKGSIGNNGEEENATLIELPKTTLTLEELKDLIEMPLSDWENEEAVKLFGFSNSDTQKPYIEIVHAYKTSVEAQYNIKLHSDITSNPSDEVNNFVSHSSKHSLYLMVFTFIDCKVGGGVVNPAYFGRLAGKACFVVFRTYFNSGGELCCDVGLAFGCFGVL